MMVASAQGQRFALGSAVVWTFTHNGQTHEFPGHVVGEDHGFWADDGKTPFGQLPHRGHLRWVQWYRIAFEGFRQSVKAEELVQR
jgi:hypothetical protein